MYVGKRLPNTYFFDYLDSEDPDSKRRHLSTKLYGVIISKEFEYYIALRNPKLDNFMQFVSFCNKIKPLTLYQEQHGRDYITRFRIFCFYSSSFTTCQSNLFSYRVNQQRRQQAMTGSLPINEGSHVKYAINNYGPFVVTLP